MKTHRARTGSRLAVALSLALIAGMLPAAAVTAQDVMEKMGNEQRMGYLAGLIDMLAYQTAASGNGALSACIADTFYRDTNYVARDRVLDAFKQFPQRRPEVIVFLLAKKFCDK